MQNDIHQQAEGFPHPLIAGTALGELTPAQRRRGLVAVLTSLFAAGITFGTSIPLLSVLLERDGVATGLIGLNTTMSVTATVVMSPFIPSLVSRVGVIRALLGGIVLIVAGFMLLPVFRSLEAWFVLRFIIGIGMSVHWVVSETWLNEVTTKGNRGFYAGLYAALMGIGFASGPALLTVIELDGWTPFLLVSGAIALAAVPLALVMDSAPDLRLKTSAGRFSTLAKAPTIFFGVYVAGLAEACLLSLMPIFGLRMGFAQNEAVLLSAVAIAGAVCLQIPIGWVNDRVNRRSMMIVSGCIGLAGAVLLPHVLEPAYLRWPMLFVWGGFVWGIYTIGLAQLGDRFRGGELSGANAMYVMSYCVGSMSGPPAAGVLIDMIGPEGLPMTMAAAFSVFLAFAAWRRLARRRAALSTPGPEA